MKNFSLYFLLVCLLSYLTPVCAQTINESNFRNVIEINRKNTVKVDDYYLIDFAVMPSEKTVIFYNNAQIPSNLFFLDSFYPEIKEFILVCPKACKIDKNDIYGINDSAKYITSTTLYHVYRDQSMVNIDSVVHEGAVSSPKLYFAKNVKLYDDYFKVYHDDCLGTSCPIQPYKEMQPLTILEYIIYYQTEHQIKLNGTYISENCDLATCTVFFTLSNLSAKEKVNFILERWISKIPDKHLKELQPYPAQIFTPKPVKTKGLKKLDF